MRSKYLFLLIFLCALYGCQIGASYQRPATELPTAWPSTSEAGAVTTPGARWWTLLYNDKVLDQLIVEALQHNRDLALAVARVDEARAQANVASSLRYPAIDATAQRDRTRASEMSPIPIPASAIERSDARAQFNVSYELDLWGRLRNAGNAARADLLATQAARDTVRIALVTEVVRSYFTLQALDEQVAVMRRTLDLRADNLRLQRVRHTAGMIGDLPLRQLEAEVLAAQAQLPALERSRTAEELALAVLLGRSPRAISGAPVQRSATEGDRNEPPPPLVPEGLPSDLLLRRPDIVQAEQRLVAANARIAVARAGMFPRIALTGYLGGESSALGDLFTAPARIWQLAFALSQPIFQAGRLSGEIEAVRARERQAVEQYQKTLQEAFREVRQALSAQLRSREIFEAETARSAALRDALRLARLRFDNGLTSQIEVIDGERNLLAAEINRLEALRARRVAVADLVKALGGGWESK